MWYCSKKKFIAALCILCAAMVIVFFNKRAGVNFTQALSNTPQNVLYFVNPQDLNKTLISKQTQQGHVKDYLAHYFSPWSKNPFKYWAKNQTPIQNYNDITGLEELTIQRFTLDRGYAINHLIYPKNWLIPIKKNMYMETQLPDFYHRAITIYPGNLRSLPTDDPSFGNWQEAGEGYPFDNLQESYIPANTPVLVLHQTLDKAWFLILVHNDIGWIHSQDIAFVDKKFIRQWQATTYLAPIFDHIDIYNYHTGEFRYSENIGTILPLVKKLSKKNEYVVLLAAVNDNQNAYIQLGKIQKRDAANWPVPMTYYKMADVMNHMLGMYYGWGGINNYRDCSTTVMNLFATFGVWLPRSSVDQAAAGNFISLENKSVKEKEFLIRKQGVPFLTLLKLPGHIVLYIGQKKGEGYIFHDFWGMHTMNIFGEAGRAIIGKTAITPLDFGEGYSNIMQTFIDKVQGMTFLS